MARYIFYIYVAFCLSSFVYMINAVDISQFHVSSERLGCESVVSQNICPATTLSPDLAIDYETDTEMLNITLEDIKANASQECISALKTMYCSSLTPRCFVNGSRDYGDARMACWKANRTCPEDSIEDGSCESLKVGLHSLSACVKPSKPINGSCPQPKYKMPQDKLELYIRSSKEYDNVGYFENLTTARFPNGSRMFSNYCVSKIKELYCLPFYCSTDEQQIVVEYTYEDCDDIILKCFDTALAELYEGSLKEAISDLQDKYIHNCGFYPDAIQPTAAGSGIPPGNISTPQTISTTPPGKNASTTTKKEIPSTTPTPLENATTTTIGQNISTTPKQYISTTPKQYISTTPKQYISTTSKEHITTTLKQNISTIIWENRSTTRPEITTSQPKDTKTFTIVKTVEDFYPTPTCGNERQIVPALLLFFVLVLVHINM